MDLTYANLTPIVGEFTGAQSMGYYQNWLPDVPGMTGSGRRAIDPLGMVNGATTFSPANAYSRSLGFGIDSAMGDLGGFRPPKPASYFTYIEMLRDPTIRLARQVVTAPLLATPWIYYHKPNIPQEWIDLVTETLDENRLHLLEQGIKSLDFGWRALELIWGVKDMGLNRYRYIIQKFKSLTSDDWRTRILADEKTGSFAGIRQYPNGFGDTSKTVDLTPLNCLLFTNDMDTDDFYGRSRLENCRREFYESLEIRDMMAKTLRKVSGIVAIIKYSGVLEHDATGQPIDIVAELKAKLADLASGNSILLRNLVAGADPDDLRNLPELAKASLNDVQFYNAGDQSATLTSYMSLINNYDVKFVRAWLRSERTATESDHGSRADSQQHTDTGMTDSELIHESITSTINCYAVDRLLTVNFGPDAKGAVWIKPAPIVDWKRETARAILKQLLTTSNTAGPTGEKIDVRSVLEAADVAVLPDAEAHIIAEVAPGAGTDNGTGKPQPTSRTGGSTPPKRINVRTNTRGPRTRASTN